MGGQDIAHAASSAAAALASLRSTTRNGTKEGSGAWPSPECGAGFQEELVVCFRMFVGSSAVSVIGLVAVVDGIDDATPPISGRVVCALEQILTFTLKTAISYKGKSIQL